MHQKSVVRAHTRAQINIQKILLRRLTLFFLMRRNNELELTWTMVQHILVIQGKRNAANIILILFLYIFFSFLFFLFLWFIFIFKMLCIDFTCILYTHYIQICYSIPFLCVSSFPPSYHCVQQHK